MDTSAVTLTEMEAGREYLKVLDRLGMDVSIATWAFDHVLGSKVLIIVTDYFDVKGPFEISRKLFQAYRSSVTPQTIDPFTVRLQSPTHPIVQSIFSYIVPGTTIHAVNKVTGKPSEQGYAIEGGTTGGLELKQAWVIRARQYSPRKSTEIVRHWNRFERNLNREAA